MIAGLTLTRDTILEHARTLPAAPQMLAGLCELLEDVNTGLDEVADQVRKDTALAARVIRISNSVVYGGSGGIGSVDDAVNRVGFSELLRLVGVATAAGLVDRSLASYGIAAEKLRESLLLHALASEAVANAAGVDARAAYVAGLLRGIGMMVLDRVGRGKIGSAEVYDSKRFNNYSDWEELRFGLGSTEVTTMILDHWRFPAESVAAIQEHLLLRESSCGDQLACVLNLAGAIVAKHGLALPGDAACWTVTPEKLAGAGLDENQFQKAGVRAVTAFKHQRAALY